MLFLLCYLACSAIYALLAGMILLQAQRNTTSWLLCAASLSTAAWAVASVLWTGPASSAVWVFDLVRAAAWYGVVLYLYNLAVADRGQVRIFISIGCGLLVAGFGLLLAGQDIGSNLSLLTGAVLLRLLLAVSQIVLLENLYRGTAADLRWHVGLVCVALGSLALYDLVLIGDAVLSHNVSLGLLEGRAVVPILAAPLLAVSIARNRNWGIALHASRTVVFHTATLMGSGIFLISLAGFAEFLKHEPWARGTNWADLLEVCLIFSGFLAIAVLLVSASARNRLARLVSQHFFTYRYDYRREWLRCVTTLSDDDGTDPGGLPRRAVRAIADIVDSPAGLLLTGEPGQSGLSQFGFVWAGSWNLPATAPLPLDHPLLAALSAGHCLELSAELLAAPPLDTVRLWLAVPLLTRGNVLAGCVLLAPPRGAFRLDDEVFSLLGVLGREVATHLAEQRATRTLVETRELRVYGERFAFVAHDIKNVAGQLRLLSSNAARHIADPAFQRDMLGTIDASVHKIGNLIRRLETNGGDAAPGGAALLMPRIEAALIGRRQARLQPVPAEMAGRQVAMPGTDLDGVLTHLLDNAVTAAGDKGTVCVSVREQQSRIVVEIADDGPGMTPEFVRDELFRPFSSMTIGGSGIGAYQARELLRRAGGELQVISTPGEGTTMRLLLPDSQSGSQSGSQSNPQSHSQPVRVERPPLAGRHAMRA